MLNALTKCRQYNHIMHYTNFTKQTNLMNGQGGLQKKINKNSNSIYRKVQTDRHETSGLGKTCMV